MERLSDQAIEIINELHTERLDYSSEYIPLIDAANRLAAYEDTGLEPEDVKKAFNEDALLKMTAQYLGTTPDRLRQWAKADKEDRLVVLPCKVGDTVWFVRPLDSKKEITETTIEKMVVKGRGVYMKLACNAMYETSCNSIGKTVFLTREEAEAALAGGGGKDAAD